mgnify:CR=1 FL=1
MQNILLTNDAGRRIRIELTDSIQGMRVDRTSTKTIVHRWTLVEEDTDAILDRGTACNKDKALQRAKDVAFAILERGKLNA